MGKDMGEFWPPLRKSPPKIFLPSTDRRHGLDTGTPNEILHDVKDQKKIVVRHKKTTLFKKGSDFWPSRTKTVELPPMHRNGEMEFSPKGMELIVRAEDIVEEVYRRRAEIISDTALKEARSRRVNHTQPSNDERQNEITIARELHNENFDLVSRRSRIVKILLDARVSARRKEIYAAAIIQSTINDTNYWDRTDPSKPWQYGRPDLIEKEIANEIGDPLVGNIAVQSLDRIKGKPNEIFEKNYRDRLMNNPGASIVALAGWIDTLREGDFADEEEKQKFINKIAPLAAEISQIDFPRRLRAGRSNLLKQLFLEDDSIQQRIDEAESNSGKVIPYDGSDEAKKSFITALYNKPI